MGSERESVTPPDFMRVLDFGKGAALLHFLIPSALGEEATASSVRESLRLLFLLDDF